MEPVAASIRAVLFDFDGTLVDSEHLHHQSWLEAAAPWGVTVSWDEYEQRLVGISDTRACEFFLGLAGLEPTAERLEIGRQRKHAVYRRRSVHELSVLPAAKGWIGRNSERVPMGVVSSSATPDVVPILDRQGVTHLMQFVLCAEHVERLKPDPFPYLLALDKLRTAAGVRDSRECLVFEDSSTGVQAAEGAGMTVHRLGPPSELPAALDSWSGRIRGACSSAPPPDGALQ